MVDAGERVRPPGDPPDGQRVWVNNVIGGGSGGRPNPEDIIDHEFVKERVKVVFPDGVHGEPVVTVGKELLEAMNGLWKNCMVVKVLGRNMSISVLSKRLREMWKPRGVMHVVDLPRQFFMIRFELVEEYLAVLTGGPWRAFGSYLMVQAWSPEFDPMRNEIVTTPVWVRLSNIPVNMYHRSILMEIATGLGKPIKVDMATLNFDRARFARICVEVNLAYPLKGTIMINAERYYVAYEGLTNICSLCGLYGHLVHACPAGKPVMPVTEKETTATVVPGGSEGGDGFTTVRKTGYRSTSQMRKVSLAAAKSGKETEGNLREISGQKESANIAVSNSFGMLEDGVVSLESRDVVITSGANKENEYPLTVVSKEQNMGHERVGLQEKVVFQGLPRANDDSKNRRVSLGKPNGNGGPKPKQISKFKATRGLVFGPTGRGVELSES
ncbi:hypothetical protein CARUB_v10023230mg, partial [Capsella rubella]